jgi:hypothetical protein
MIVHEIPGVLVIEWDDEVKATFDTWSSYAIKLPQFREAILEKGVANARARGGRAWVMDATKAKGAFLPEVQTLIETEVLRTFAAIGIKYFLTIKSASTITNMSINRYTAQLGPNGIQMVEVPSRDKAIEWLKAHQ